MDNNYHARVFLSGLLGKPDYMNSRIWKEHQEMQARFLLSKGLTPDSTVLDVGCGPLRLGVALIPRLTRGWYYGVDINADTLKAGRKVLSDAGVEASRVTLVCSADFDTALVDRPIDIAFSNSLFSHLSLNSVLMCLKRVRGVIKEDGRYYSTFFAVDRRDWLAPAVRQKWGRTFNTFPDRDPYHYSESMLGRLADEAGFRMSLADDFGHPTQTMACFAPV